VISPKLVLMIPRVTCQETWTTQLTAMRNRCPEVAIRRISWRKGHHEGAVWALPQVLPAQERADRVEEGRRRRPGGMHVYLAELLTITINGSLGPQPDVLLTEFLTQVRTALGRALARGRPESALYPDQYLEERGGDGAWNGVIVLRLTSSTETARLCELLHGAVVDIGGSFSTVTAFNPRVDATGSRLRRAGGRGGGSR